jgi:hypothetical protein
VVVAYEASMAELGKSLIVLGALIVVAGVVLSLAGRWPRLPGDIVIRRDDFVFVFPLTTCLLVSVVASIILYWLRR